MTKNETAMKKAVACWNIHTSLDVDCPHCGSIQDIYDNYDFWESVNEEFDEDDCDDMEIECEYCDKTFGLKAINKE